MQCNAITKAGTRCKNAAMSNGLCGRHQSYCNLCHLFPCQCKITKSCKSCRKQPCQCKVKDGPRHPDADCKRHKTPKTTKALLVCSRYGCNVVIPEGQSTCSQHMKRATCACMDETTNQRCTREVSMYGSRREFCAIHEAVRCSRRCEDLLKQCTGDSCEKPLICGKCGLEK